MLTTNDQRFLNEARAQAEKSWSEGGIPIGAALAHNGTLLAVGHNKRVQQSSATLHGEIDCLETAGRLPASTYRDCTLYTTLSPCPMCTGAILLYGIPRVVIGENTTFTGCEDTLRAAGVDIIIANDPQCISLMKQMKTQRPDIWAEDIGEDAA